MQLKVFHRYLFGHQHSAAAALAVALTALAAVGSGLHFPTTSHCCARGSAGRSGANSCDGAAHGTANACQGAVVAAGCSGGTLTFAKEFYRGQISLSALKDRGVQRGVFQCRESDSPLQCLLS